MIKRRGYCLTVVFILLVLIQGAFLCETAIADNQTITFSYPNFSNVSMNSLLKLNGHATITSGKLRLTRNAGHQRGSAFYNNRVSLANERSFSTFFSFQLKDSYYKGKADGFVFAIQTQSNTAGSSGSGIGFAGISPSVGIEFDTWRNSEAATPHVGVDLNGSVSSLVTKRTPYDIRNGSIYYAWIDYDGHNKVIEIRLSNTDTRPVDALLTRSDLDLTSILNMDEVFVGFTSATGNAGQNHYILSWYFNNDYEPIDTENNTYENNAAGVEVTANPADNTKQSVIKATVTDAEGNNEVGTTVTFSTTAGNLSSSTATTDENGQASVTLSSAGPSASAVVKAVAEGGAYGTVNIELLANNFPIFTGDATNTVQVIDEGMELTAVVATDADVGESISYTLTNGSLPAGITMNDDGIFLGTATCISSGSYSVVITASDGYGGTAVTALNITVNDTLPAPTAHTQEASVTTLTPAVGGDNLITLTVKDALNNTYTDFDGAKDVLISGVVAAPDGSCGKFNGTVLDAASTGAGQTIPVDFTDGIASANLVLNKAGGHDIVFSIATVATPESNILNIRPTPGSVVSMGLIQDITAPASNGGSFAQQPVIMMQDVYGNVCDGDSTTVVSAAKNDAGDWTLTGTNIITVNNGLAAFNDLGAVNAEQVENAQMVFSAGALIPVTSSTVILPPPGAELPPLPEDGSSSASSEQSEEANNTDAEILVNGKSEQAGKVNTTRQRNQTISTVTVDQQILEQKLEQEGPHSVVTIPINNDDVDIVVGELNGEMVKKMEGMQSVLEIKTGDITYSLPAQQLNIDRVAEQFRGTPELQDIKVSIEISAPPSGIVAVIENQEKNGEFSIVVPPMSFNVRCSYGQQTVEVNSFNSYIERNFRIPDGVAPDRITTGVIVEPDGTMRHVPTKIVIIEGRYYARINSLTNSVYTIIWHPIEFRDVGQHWAENPINEMGSRLVMSGITEDIFEPDAEMTRAEFVNSIINALGLDEQEGTTIFSDVFGYEWYSGAIATIYNYGIIGGYEDGSFKPNRVAKREEAMAVIARALNLMGMNTDITSEEVEKQLAKFEDNDRFGEWVKRSAAYCVKMGIVVSTDGMANPKRNITRAETAAMIMRMLKTAELI